MTLTLFSIEDAWPHFATRMFGHFQVLERENRYTDEMSEDDNLLAYFIRLHPGVFEARLLAGLGELAAAKDAKGISNLSRLLEVVAPSDKSPGSLVGMTLSALDPLAGIKLCGIANWHHYGALSGKARDNCGYLIVYFKDRYQSDLAAADVTSELRDGFSGKNPPDIIPGNLDGMSPEDIKAVIEVYVGAPIEAVEARLYPGHSSSNGFLAEGERLARVIWDDAKKLREIRVDRHALAKRIRELGIACDVGRERTLPQPNRVRRETAEETELREQEWRRIFRSYVYEEEPPFQVTTTSYMGIQQNPFYTRCRGSNGSFIIRNQNLGPASVLEGGYLTLWLIESLCFFEGNVPNRIDPETAARVLGFIE
jgi:hypothetical protein